jgi:hypothetical protein
MPMKTWEGLLLGLLSGKESLRRDSDKETDRQRRVIDIYLFCYFLCLIFRKEGVGNGEEWRSVKIFVD